MIRIPLIDANWIAPGMKGEEGPRCTTPRGDGVSDSTTAPCPLSRQPNCTTETTGLRLLEYLESRRRCAPWLRCSSVVTGGCGQEENAAKLTALTQRLHEQQDETVYDMPLQNSGQSGIC